MSGTISGAGRDEQTLSRCHEQIDSYFAPPIIEGTRVLEELNHDESQGCAFLKVDHGPIDHFLGGGLQRGRLTEIYGESGKGLLILNCLSWGRISE